MGHRDLEDVFEDRLREVRGEEGPATAPDPGNSRLVIGLVCAGTAAVLLFLFLFLRNERRRSLAPTQDVTSQPDDSSGEVQRQDSGSRLPRNPPGGTVKSRDVRYRLPESSVGGPKRPRKP